MRVETDIISVVVEHDQILSCYDCARTDDWVLHADMRLGRKGRNREHGIGAAQESRLHDALLPPPRLQYPCCAPRLDQVRDNDRTRPVQRRSVAMRETPGTGVGFLPSIGRERLYCSRQTGSRQLKLSPSLVPFWDSGPKRHGTFRNNILHKLFINNNLSLGRTLAFHQAEHCYAQLNAGVTSPAQENQG